MLPSISYFDETECDYILLSNVLQTSAKAMSQYNASTKTPVQTVLKTYLLTLLTWTNGDNYKDLIRW